MGLRKAALGILLAGLGLVSAPSLSQRPGAALVQTPVRAKTEITAALADSVSLTIELKIAPGWHVYSTDQTGGPTSAALRTDSIYGLQASGSLSHQGHLQSCYDQVFESQVSYFEDSVRFIQTFSVTGPQWYIEGDFTYGACNDESCLPPSHVEFRYSSADISRATGNITETPQLQSDATDLSAIPDFDNETWKPVTYDSISPTGMGRGLWGLLLTSMLGGLLALLTPCVWPIIPMTVSFFIKRSTERSKAVRDAVLFGLCIMVVYVSLGLAVTLAFGASALNALATNAVVNIIFFLILVLFALSFFGLFELALPGSWSTGADRKAGKSGKSGFAGLFFMALTLAIVSFSCTGPIIGFLLVDAAQNGSLLAPALGMTGFSFALAVPFTLFAMFPHWLESIPKSGSWMTKVKVTLGFIELAFSLKFLSVADMAYGWGILPRPLFIVLWIAMAVALGLYLTGIPGRLLKRHKSKQPGTAATIAGCTCLAFAIALVPGLKGAPLKFVSAFLPPMTTMQPAPETAAVTGHLTDYNEALRQSAASGKPVLIDFTGYGCVNCRKMEAAVWTDPSVAQTMARDFIVVSLYVDDRTPLPQPVSVTENGQTVKLRNTGDKWSLLQRYKFGANAQPFYVTVNSNGELLSGPYTFDQDPQHFVQFLSSHK